MFGENFGLKVISVGLALLLEIYFYSPDNSVVAAFTAGVDLVGLPPSTMVIGPPEAREGISVRVQVRGPKPLIDQVRSVQQRFRVSPPSGAGANFTLMFDETNLSLPAGVDVLNIEPKRLAVKTEREVKKELRVVLNEIGESPKGYQVDKIKIFPATVVVRGPYSSVGQLQAVETEVVDISTIQESTRVEVALKDLGDMVSPSVTLVAVDLTVSEAPKQKSLSKVNVKVLAPPGFAATVQPTRAAVTLAGPPSKLGRLTETTFSLNADGRNLGVGRHLVPLTLQTRDFGFVDGHDHLAAEVVRHAMFIAEPLHRQLACAAIDRFQRAWLVIDPGMEHTRVTP